MHAAYDELTRLLREAATLGSVSELLAWDQETMMPSNGAAFRAEERALISTLIHRRVTAERVGELLAECESDAALTADERIAANLREMRRDYDRARKLPESLVAEISETDSLAMEAWKEARGKSDYAGFLPWIEKQIELNRRKAECWGAPEGGELYDALLDAFEPYMTAAELERIFAPLREETVKLARAIAESGREPARGPLDAVAPVDRQQAFNLAVLAKLGFTPDAGRLDVSAHPFSVGLAPGDTRITTRYKEDQIFDALSSTMHEAGHALYEQGLPKAELHGQPLAEPVGLGIHESQSRLWENQVGRSRSFWEWALPQATEAFGSALGSPTVDETYAAVNIVRPGFIRVESDEVTYNLHIMLRFDLERALMRGDLAPADLPGAWNDRVRSDLGLEVPDDRRGCLQDVHWAMGAFGYFPSYTLGNLYAAQLWETAEGTLTDLSDQIRRGEFGELLGWLRKHVHAHGRRFTSAELCERITGRPLSHEPLATYLNTKLRPIYGL